jgi:hypothetical protein
LDQPGAQHTSQTELARSCTHFLDLIHSKNITPPMQSCPDTSSERQQEFGKIESWHVHHAFLVPSNVEDLFPDSTSQIRTLPKGG